jgi:hypothetical protein
VAQEPEKHELERIEELLELLARRDTPRPATRNVRLACITGAIVSIVMPIAIQFAIGPLIHIVTVLLVAPAYGLVLYPLLDRHLRSREDVERLKLFGDALHIVHKERINNPQMERKADLEFLKEYWEILNSR